MHRGNEASGDLLADDMAVDVQVLRSFMKNRVGRDMLGRLVVAVKRYRKLWIGVKLFHQVSYPLEFAHCESHAPVLSFC